MTGLDTLGRRARAGLTQTIGVLFGAGAAIGLMHIGAAPQISTSSVATVLIGLSGAVFGTLAVIFSLLFLVVQWVATTFTPRLTLFRDAPIVWRTAAVAMSVIVFCITAILASGSRDTMSASVPLVAVVGTLAVLVLLRVVLANALAATQISPVLTTICEHGQQSIVATYPTSDDLDPKQVDSPAEPRSILWSRNPLVLQRLHVERLVHLAESADSVIVMEETVGSTLRAGATLAHVYGRAPQSLDKGNRTSEKSIPGPSSLRSTPGQNAHSTAIRSWPSASSPISHSVPCRPRSTIPRPRCRRSTRSSSCWCLQRPSTRARGAGAMPVVISGLWSPDRRGRTCSSSDSTMSSRPRSIHR